MNAGVFGLFILGYFNLVGAEFNGIIFGSIFCMLLSLREECMFRLHLRMSGQVRIFNFSAVRRHPRFMSSMAKKALFSTIPTSSSQNIFMKEASVFAPVRARTISAVTTGTDCLIS